MALTNREHYYYMIGLFGPNGGVPDERFVRTLHRLYGVAFTRNVLFPDVLGRLRHLQYQYVPTRLSRLVVWMRTASTRPTVRAALDDWRDAGWVTEECTLPGTTQKFLLASLTDVYAGMQSAGVTSGFRADWKCDRDPKVAQHVHDALLAGQPFDQIQRPAPDDPVQVVGTPQPADTAVSMPF